MHFALSRCCCSRSSRLAWLLARVCAHQRVRSGTRSTICLPRSVKVCSIAGDFPYIPCAARLAAFAHVRARAHFVSAASTLAAAAPPGARKTKNASRRMHSRAAVRRAGAEAE
eukprot:3178079-Prymnesium_polylepis.1